MCNKINQNSMALVDYSSSDGSGDERDDADANAVRIPTATQVTIGTSSFTRAAPFGLSFLPVAGDWPCLVYFEGVFGRRPLCKSTLCRCAAAGVNADC